MSKPILKMTNPPAIRKPLVDSPKNLNKNCPDRVKMIKVIKATIVARRTIALRSLFDRPWVIVRNTGMVPNGFVIFKIGFDMLQARYSNAKLSDEEVKTYMNDISITPLAIPMLCGPGAIANAIMLMEDAHTITLKIALICTIAFVYFLAFLILSTSTRLINLLGETGNNVMMRLMGLILMVIAVECFISGFKPIAIDILQSAR